MEKVTIKVPATSANLGPGFDCLGIAYDLYNEFIFEKKEDGFTFSNVEDEYQNEDNLSVVAFKAAMAETSVKNAGFHMTEVHVNVPISRGLGSSSTMIVAGVLAFNYLYDANFSKEDIIKIATKVEGHPDNVVPALLGGLTCSIIENDQIVVESFSPSESLHYILMIPDFMLSTKESRSVLPKEVLMKDAIFNISHGILLISALESGNGEKIALSLKDKIHQPYRKKLIEDYDIILDEALSLGAYGICLSGAGPTMLAICPNDISVNLEDNLKKICKASWKVLDLKANMRGTIVE